jgi:copper chaperone
VSNVKQLTLEVSGMSCTGCEERIQTALARLEGVLRSQADHQAGKVQVVVDPGRASEEAVRRSIEKAGYGVSP